MAGWEATRKTILVKEMTDRAPLGMAGPHRKWLHLRRHLAHVQVGHVVSCCIQGIWESLRIILQWHMAWVLDSLIIFDHIMYIHCPSEEKRIDERQPKTQCIASHPTDAMSLLVFHRVVSSEPRRSQVFTEPRGPRGAGGTIPGQNQTDGEKKDRGG